MAKSGEFGVIGDDEDTMAAARAATKDGDEEGGLSLDERELELYEGLCRDPKRAEEKARGERRPNPRPGLST